MIEILAMWWANLQLVTQAAAIVIAPVLVGRWVYRRLTG